MASASGGHSIQCPLCLDTCAHQCVLVGCLHSFCDKCIVASTKKQFESKQSHKCPICYTPFQGPESSKRILEWSRNLPINVFLTARDGKESISQHSECEPCGFRGISSKAVRFCTTCKESQCQGCASVHSSSRGSRNHRVVSIEDADDEAERNDHIDVTALMTCSKHINKNVEYFCESHDVFVCPKCALTEHKDCNELKDISTDVNADIHIVGDLEESTKQVTVHMENVYTTVHEEYDKFSNESSKFKSKMNKLRNQVNAVFDAYENECDIKLSNVSTVQKKDLEKIRNTQQQYIVAAENVLLMYEYVRQHGNPYQNYYYGKQLEYQISAYEKFIREHLQGISQMRIESVVFNKTKSIVETKTIGSLNIRQEKIQLPKLAIDWSRLQLKTTSSERDGMRIFKAENENAEMDTAIENTSDVIVEKTDASLGKAVWASSKKYVPLEKTSIPSNINGVAFLKNGQIVVTNSKKRKLYLMGSDLAHVIQDKTLHDMPAEVASFASTNRLAVTLVNEWKILIVSDKLTPLWAVETVYQPAGISMLPDDSMLVSTRTGMDKGNSCFRTIKGSKERKITSVDIEVDEHFAADGSGTMLIASSPRTSEVACLTLQGSRIFSYTIPSPGDVDVDKYGQIYVIGKANNEVHKLSQVGRRLDVLGFDKSLKANRLKMNSDRNKLIVTFQDSSVVCFWDID